MYRIIGTDQKEYGPVKAEQIRQWILDRRLNCNSLAMAEGGPWKPLSDFSEFSATLGAIAPVFPGLQQQAAQINGTNPMATAGLICGLLSWPAICCCQGLPFNVLGLVFSIIALSQLRRNTGQRGKGMAIAGLVLSILQILIFVGFLIAGSTIGWNDLMRGLKQ